MDIQGREFLASFLNTIRTLCRYYIAWVFSGFVYKARLRAVSRIKGSMSLGLGCFSCEIW